MERRNKRRELGRGKNAKGTLGAKTRAVKRELGGKGAFRFETVGQSDRGRVWIRCSQITRAFLSSHPHTTKGKGDKKTNA